MAGNREILSGFVVIEGIDGAGTSTQKDLLCQAAQEQGRQVFNTCEPSPGPAGTLIRRVLRQELSLPPWSLALLFAADREDHLNGNDGIRQHCAAGTLCVSDRYFHSSLAYQGLVCDSQAVEQLNAGFPAPEYLVFLDVPVAESARRRQKRGQSAEIFEEDSFLDRVRQAYHQAIIREQQANPGVKLLRLDGSRSIKELHHKICAFVGIMPIQ